LFFKTKISTAYVIMHKPAGPWTQVLSIIFVTLPDFLSAVRKQVAYHHSSAIRYLTHSWLLFFHWAMKRRGEARAVSCHRYLCRSYVLSGALHEGREEKTFARPKRGWQNTIKNDLRENYGRSGF